VLSEFVLPHASIASSGDEYFQVLFDRHPEGMDDDTP
jgi:hypothetical protein